jgi:putative membrane-bound dehydrogenase-like protein
LILSACQFFGAGAVCCHILAMMSAAVTKLEQRTLVFATRSVITAVAFLSLALALAGRAAEPALTAADLPRMPPVEPKDAPGTFQVKQGFHIELVASEPLVASPVALSFDERGRMFVVEMIDYSERRDETPHLGRIRMLEDTNGDGIFDKSTVFADNLPWPTAVFCYNGGVFVGATPDIIYLKDTNGDGKADVREVVFTGFAEGQKRVNVQEMLNSFIWGLDNRIHGATSGDGGLVKSLRHPEAPPVDLQGRDFVIDPRTMTLTSEAGGGQHGLSFDDWGRRFACNNSDHIRLFMYEDWYAARNPFYAMPAPLASIAVDGPAAEVYRVSPEEPWRVIRTRWRVAGLVNGPIEGGGRSAGYFTGATGTTIYRGDAFPSEFRDNAFVGDAGGNLVHRKILYPDDVGLKAQRAPAEEHMEFAASRDTWFRPVQFANTPDGTLYVIDMYREIIEHPWSLPPSIKKFLDLNSGNDRGRIYRIAPDGFKQPNFHRLDTMTTAELVATLESPNGWYRDTASRLLYERRDKTAAPLLVKLLETSKSSFARLHALHSLDGLNALDPRNVLTALEDQDAWVRTHAVKLSEKLVSDPKYARPIFLMLARLVADPSNLVRYQLAFTLGEFREAQPTEPALRGVRGTRADDLLAAIARRDADSPWIQAAVLSSLAHGAGVVFTKLADAKGFCASKSGQDFLRQLVQIIGAQNRPGEISQVVKFIAGLSDSGFSFSLVRALGNGLQRAGSSLDKMDQGGSLKAGFADAAKTVSDGNAPESVRLQGIQLLGLTSFSQSGQPLLSLLSSNQTQPIQLAAVSALSHFSEPQVTEEMTRRWAIYAPRVRSAVVSALLSRPERAVVLLHAIESSAVPATDLTTAQTKFLRTHADKPTRELALKVLGKETPNKRQEVIDAYQPALALKGDTAKGKEIYLQRCTSCHRSGGNGFALGPDLVTVKNTGKEKLLVNILDPSREVAPQYIAFQIDTKDGESLLGIIASETTSSVTVRQAYGKEDVVLRSNMKGMTSQGQSLMPEGLEQGLTPQDFANLLEYISTAN